MALRPIARVLLLVVLAAGSVSLPAGAQVLIPPTTAARYGLTRAWYAQVGSPRVSGTLAHAGYDEGMVLVQSSRGRITALDAETGRTLWSNQIGARDGASSEPAANEKFVVVVNGSTLYVLNRSAGDIVWQRELRGAPGAGPAMSSTHAFVPLVSGFMEGHDLEKGARQTPWNFQSTGRLLTAPMTTQSTVSWTTDRGYLFAADPAGGGIRYRLATRGAIQARPAAWSPYLFAGSVDGYVYALDEASGQLRWEFPTGEAIYEAPVALEGRVFVVSEFSGMYCLDAASGKPLWHARSVAQFVAASPGRVYVVDRVGSLAILEISGGARLGALPLAGIATKVVNTKSDRIFLVDHANVVQCLHETQLRAPYVYTPPPPPEKPAVKLGPKSRTAPPAAPDKPAEEPPTETPPAETPRAEEPAATDNPFDAPAPEKPAAESENPFEAPK
jgi:outer membrane protein assembly factor BamB